MEWYDKLEIVCGRLWKIKSAEMECAPLTLIVGDNNCGKSYLMSLLWGIKNIGAIHLLKKRCRDKRRGKIVKGLDIPTDKSCI